ncbi:hypothetical protein IRJ41_006577 [Triplophysa rosa]|uniref:Catenin alpha-2 n=1 Tax=Triplophysa rosa TaxID=992332 RepID=A0A9W7WZ09_TRIRA|nr:hypothetical protein IRJ41_006577 [Triplophysa rosa]
MGVTCNFVLNFAFKSFQATGTGIPPHGFSKAEQTGRKEKGDLLNSAIDKMTKKTRDLRRQLRKAVMDHISDSFLETNVPLLVLIEAAKSGNEKEVKEYAQVFREHANKLVERLQMILIWGTTGHYQSEHEVAFWKSSAKPEQFDRAMMQ